MDVPSWQTSAPFLSLCTHAAAIAVVASQFDALVPEPYMDEIFHVPQAQAYCEGRWGQWDPKITTPPGLYLPVAIGHHIFPRSIVCTTTALRLSNALLLFLLPFIIFRILSHFRSLPYPPRTEAGAKLKVRFLIPDEGVMIEAIVISCFPIAYFSGFMFYTDLASLCSVLLCYDCGLRGHHVLAGLVGLLSLWVRQTNVVWVAFVAGVALVTAFKGDVRPTEAIGGLHDPPLIQSSLLDVPKSTWSLARGLLRNVCNLLPIAAPYIAVVASFGGFLLWNGGIVLGDKSHHETALHIPQLLYFTGFSGIFLAPFLFDRNAIHLAVNGVFGSFFRVLLTASAAGAAFLAVRHFTFVHPFVLADNRHYTFYIWRRIIDRHWTARYLLIPPYLISARLLWQRLARSYTLTLLPTLFYLVAVSATLIPSPLLEPRYFLIPYVLLRVHLRPLTSEYGSWEPRLGLEWANYVSVNLVTLGVFLYRPWKAPPGTWEGEWQRFMW